MTLKPAADLCPGDVILVHGVPVDLVRVEHWMFTVKGVLSDDPEDCQRWRRDDIVEVVGHFRAVICV